MRARMRTRPGLVFFLALCSCVTVSGASRRVALAPSPGAPPQLRGSPGIGLVTRIPFANPSGGNKGDGIAVPVIQPELNGVFKFNEHAYGSFDATFALGGDTHPARPDLPRVQADLSFSSLIGAGYDFTFGMGGLSVSGEGGFDYVSVTTTISGTSLGVSNVLLFAGRLAVAPYLEARGFRIFGGGVVGTDVWSEADGFAAGCPACGTVTDSGRTESRALFMLGGGMRYQAVPQFAVGFEVWVPLSTAGVRQPPQAVLALQVGDFDFSLSRRPPPPAPPQPGDDDYVPPPPSPPTPEMIPLPVPL